MKKLVVHLSLIAGLIAFNACQPEMDELGIEPQSTSEINARSASTSLPDIQVIKGMLAFDNEEDFMATMEHLIIAEQDQTSEGEETHPGLADFENQFEGFTSQRLTIRDDIFLTEYDAENIPGSNAVQSPAIQTLLNENGKVRVAGTVFTFTREGITNDSGESIASGRGEGGCCFRWNTNSKLLRHSNNQYLVGYTYVYSWSFFGNSSIFVKGTTSMNFIGLPFLVPFSADRLKAEPVAAYYRLGHCEADLQWFDIGARFTYGTWLATHSGSVSNSNGQAIFNASSDIHFINVRQYGVTYYLSFHNC